MSSDLSTSASGRCAHDCNHYAGMVGCNRGRAGGVHPGCQGTVRAGQEATNPSVLCAPGGPTRVVLHETSTPVVQGYSQEVRKQTLVQQSFSPSPARGSPGLARSGYRPSQHPDGTQGPGNDDLYRCNASRLWEIMGQNAACELWPRGPRALITALEMEAVWRALQHFASFLVGRHILVMTDSITTKAYINRQGGVISGRCNEWVRCIWLWVAENARSIRALHSPGKNNVAADIPERGSARRRLELESSNCGIAVGMLRYSLGGLVCCQGQSQMPHVVLHVTERRSAAGVECTWTGTVARGPALRIPSIFLPPRPPGEIPWENV